MYVMWKVAKRIILIFAAAIGLLLLGVPQQFVSWALIGAYFGAMAHATKSPYWQYLRHKNINPFSETFGQSSLPRPETAKWVPIAQRLDTPSKRVAFLVFVLSVVTCGVTFALFKLNEHYYRGFFDAMFNATWRYHGYRLVFVLSCVCLCVSYIYSSHYSATFGAPAKWLARLFGWVKHGDEKNS
ncbi:hypothetical protein GCM10009121_25460 [Rhodanobacter soli]